MGCNMKKRLTKADKVYLSNLVAINYCAALGKMDRAKTDLAKLKASLECDYLYNLGKKLKK